MTIKIEAVDSEFGNSQTYDVLKTNSRGDLVLDTKPRTYVEFVSSWSGKDAFKQPKADGTYGWVNSYIKTSKNYFEGYVRRVV